MYLYSYAIRVDCHCALMKHKNITQVNDCGNVLAPIPYNCQFSQRFRQCNARGNASVLRKIIPHHQRSQVQVNTQVKSFDDPCGNQCQPVIVLDVVADSVILAYRPAGEKVVYSTEMTVCVSLWLQPWGGIQFPPSWLCLR